ncbi:hypothetical protein KIW84_057731 [Lathyrus oleraceus]|uniref:Uncharacterized protein n=1 Tax=Pisum sativum TaxID=3888 RepID=A0A9D4X2Z4_PEA|nr:hypothetical protein KIW84_057731 [Pisum sativum]
MAPYGNNVRNTPLMALGHASPLFPSPSTFVANAFPSSCASWFPNLGTSYHVTIEANNLLQLTPLEGPDQIFIGNDQD